jgi:hypothetical protein
MVVVHDPVIDLMAVGVAREHAVRRAPVRTARVAETAGIHGACAVDDPICCIVGVACEDQICPTAAEEIAQLAVTDDGVDARPVVGVGRLG